MSPTLQEAIIALRPYLTKVKPSKSVNIVKSLSGKFKGMLQEGESSTKIIRNWRNTGYGRI